jgi:hypothetical protein
MFTNLRLSAIISAFILASAAPVFAGEAAPKPTVTATPTAAEAAKVPARELAEAVVANAEAQRAAPPGLAGREDVAKELLAMFPKVSVKAQETVLWSSLEIGRRSPLPDHWTRFWVFSEGAAALLVEAAASKDKDTRSVALRLLQERFPDRYLKPHAARLLEIAPGDALLLGKTGAPEAKAVLKAGGPSSAEDVKLALAKLGDATLSAEFVKAFDEAKDAREKGKIAHQLGYIADKACVMALAREIRNPAVYVGPGTNVSFRKDIVEALSIAYPDEQVFWRPEVPTDAWYASIEEWLTRKLGVTWTEPRPPVFFDGPMPIPMAGQEIHPTIIPLPTKTAK